MWGSLDAIESTQFAVDFYSGLNKDDFKYLGFQYLVVYGLFQALYVQQDSVRNLCKSVAIPMPKKEKDFAIKYPELSTVRQLRNSGMGHPSGDRKNNTHGMLIEEDSIQLHSYTEEGEFSFTTHEISKCVETQNHSLCRILQQVIEKMELMEKRHKDKYMKTKLRDFFPPDPQYCIDKIFAAINLIDVQDQEKTAPQTLGRQDTVRLALSNSETLIKAINQFNEEFTKRGLHNIYVCLEIKHSKYPLEKLKEYFASKNSINSQDARAYADSARIHILDLVQHAEDLDDEYSNSLEEKT